MKKRIILKTLALALTLSFTVQAGDVVDRIVALVDDKAITQTDVDQALRTGRMGKDRTEVTQNLINTRILEGELEKEKVSVTELDVDNAVKDIATRQGRTPDTLRADLDKKGMSYMAFRDSVREDLKRNQFMQKVIYPRVRVNDYDVQQYYNRHPNEFQGFQKLRFYEIVLTPESLPTGQNLEGFAGAMVNALRQGAPFSQFATKYSKGAFASQGGDSGLLEIATMRQDLANILTAAPVNVVSDPLPLGGGAIFIFKVVDRRDPKPRALDDVKEIIRQKLASEKVHDEMENFLMEARNRHFVDVRS